MQTFQEFTAATGQNADQYATYVRAELKKAVLSLAPEWQEQGDLLNDLVEDTQGYYEDWCNADPPANYYHEDDENENFDNGDLAPGWVYCHQCTAPTQIENMSTEILCRTCDRDEN